MTCDRRDVEKVAVEWSEYWEDVEDAEREH